MISNEDIKKLAVEWGVSDHVVEKNYVIGWLLWGIGGDKDIGHKWIFKGGTCLKKCYLVTYRFSEDLDFTVLPDGPLEPADIQPILNRILERIHDESGINFSLREPLLKKKDFPFYTEGRIYYQGPRGTPSPASIKIDLLSSEKLVHPPVRNRVAHNYADDLPKTARVMCYSLEEIFAEKIRAMGERGMPRDLYDIIFLFRQRFGKEKSDLVKSILTAKCEAKGIPVPTFETIKNSPSMKELKSEWANMLEHQLPALPPFENYWEELPNLFDWIKGEYKPTELEPVKTQPGDKWISHPVGPTLELIMRRPIEAIRFAAINHLCVEMRYRKGGTLLKNYVIQPYSLRRSKDENIVMYAVKANTGEIRAFRIDWISQVHLTTKPFKPVFRIEFPEVGTIYAPEIERGR